MVGRHALSVALALSLCFGAGAPLAQSLSGAQSEILVIDPNKLFAETLFGKRISQQLEEEGQALAQDNRRIEQELRDEEKAITEQRPTMDAEEFQDVAEAFDQKVQAIRQERLEKARALEEKRANAEQRFLATAQGILVELMNERGGNVLLDIRSVILRDGAIDITSDAVDRIDAKLGSGEGIEAIPPDGTDQTDEAGEAGRARE